MAIDEPTRHRVYGRLEEVLGGEVASTLMSHMPPVKWTDIATKRDLQNLELRIEGSIDRRIADLTRTLVLASTGQMVAFAGVLFAAVRLA